MHLDYEKHPITKRERRLNIILYLNRDWQHEWGGATELWDKNMSKCVARSHVAYNTAILFKTNDISWHGVPERITCPEGVFRKTFSCYFFTDLEESDTKKRRLKAHFVKRPQDEFDARLEELYKIRSNRRIEKEDMDAIFPEWTVDM
jgi:hypothetical protein